MTKPMIVELCRTVRFCLNSDGALAADEPVINGYAGWPSPCGLCRYYELHVSCAGPVDPVTGYFVNITQIDSVVRQTALPMFSAATKANDDRLGWLMSALFTTLDKELAGRVRHLALQLTPTCALGIEEADMANVLISQQYQFSAAHRLHTEQLSDEENRRVFGKCNNPSGHGHNYKLEVTVRCPIDSSGAMMTVGQLDEVVNHAVIGPLDHKHLNVDVPRFAKVNPSVENIAQACYEMLADEVGQLGVKLEQVKVWETEKTVCTYRG